MPDMMVQDSESTHGIYRSFRYCQFMKDLSDESILAIALHQTIWCGEFHKKAALCNYVAYIT
jgi:hypothetical protein